MDVTRRTTDSISIIVQSTQNGSLLHEDTVKLKPAAYAWQANDGRRKIKLKLSRAIWIDCCFQLSQHFNPSLARDFFYLFPVANR